jgi:hypothetical protein
MGWGAYFFTVKRNLKVLAVPIALPEIENSPKNIYVGIRKMQNLSADSESVKKVTKKISRTK